MSSPVLQSVRQAARRLAERLEVAECIFEVVAPILDDFMTELIQLQLVGEANRIPSGEIWKIAGDLLSHGRLQHRARMKPRGYAGDFELIAWMSDHELCGDPLGRLFDRYFQKQQAPQAVRHRTQIVADAIVETCEAQQRVCKVVSVGAGPARDIFSAVGKLSPPARRRLQVVLLDLDPDALEYATKSLTTDLSSDQVIPVRENLFRLPRRTDSNRVMAEADLIFCTGLFDYLDDPEAAAMARLFYEQLIPNGRSLIFNFAPHNPTRPYMEWIGNWYLTYRSADQMKQLAGAANFSPACWELKTEALGIDLYLDVRKES